MRLIYMLPMCLDFACHTGIDRSVHWFAPHQLLFKKGAVPVGMETGYIASTAVHSKSFSLDLPSQRATLQSFVFSGNKDPRPAGIFHELLTGLDVEKFRETMESGQVSHVV